MLECYESIVEDLFDPVHLVLAFDGAGCAPVFHVTLHILLYGGLGVNLPVFEDRA